MPNDNDKPELFVVDGSNIATEGRSKPSLEQLNEAVEAFRGEYPDVRVTVVVDATFGHRIAKKEVKAFDKAVAANELVTPPAGAVGRGDAFILAIADKAGAGVFSNDSFQEFHGEYEWLFENGRLIGGKPVPNVGWVFVDRNPVRGRKSREAIKAAKQSAQGDGSPTESKEKARRRVRKKRAAATDSDTSTSEPATDDASADDSKQSDSKQGSKQDDSKQSDSKPDDSKQGSKQDDSKQEATTSGSSSRGSQRGSKQADAKSVSSSGSGGARSNQVNDPGAFFDFVEHHQVGTWVTGVVDSYSSHGAYARVGDVLVYIPLRLMADPAPTSARKVLTTGDDIEVVIVAFVPDRLSIDAALPAMAPAADRSDTGAAEPPADEPPADEPPADEPPAKKQRARRRSSKRTSDEPAEADATPVKRSAAKKKAAKKSAAKKAPAKRAPARKKAPAKKAAAKKAPAKKKAAAKRAPAKKKAAAKRAPAKKKAAAKKAPAKRAAKQQGAAES